MKRAIQQTFMVSALAFAVNQAFALPKEPTIVNGNVQITPSSNAMEIQHSAGAIVNWKGFDIDNGQTVKFVAPNEQAAILNRVVSGNQASTWISGRLESNGRVFLINPNGIIFGYSSVVDVGGLVASTLNITNENFLANNWLFESTGKKNGISINTGSQINIKPNSYLWLFGNRVTNMSTINAQASMVVMAAGEKVYVSENDSSNMFFEVTPNSSIDLSVSDNSIMINEDASVDVMQGGSFGAFGHNVIQAGSIYLDAASVDGGNAIFSARNNLSLYNSSKIYTSGAGQQSGSVYLQAGNQLTIDSGSSIRVNGDFGGQDGWLTMTAGQIDDNGSVNAGSSNLVVRNYAYNTLATPFFTTLKSNGQQIVIAAGSEFLPPASPVVTPPAPSGTPVTTGVGTVSPPPSTTTTTASSTQSTVEGGGAVTPRQSSQPSSTEVTGTQAGTATNGAGGTSTTPVSMPPSTGGSVVIVPDDDIAAPSSSGTPRATEVNTGVTVDPTSQVATGNPIDVTITNPNPPRLPPQVSTGSQSGVTESGVVTEGASSGVVTSSGVISSGVSGSVTATPVGSANIDNNQPPQVATGAGQTDTQTVLGATTNGNQPPQANGSGQTSTINQGSINGNTPTTPLNNTNPTPPAIQPQTAQQYLATKDRSQLQALGTQFANAPIGSSVTINVVDANGMSIPISRLEWLTALRANNVETNFGSNTGSTTTPSTVPSSTTVSGAVLTGGGTPASQGTTQATNTTPSNPTTTTTNGGAASSPNNVTGSTPVSVIQNPAVPLNPTTSIPVGSRPTTGNGSVAVNNNTTAPITVIPPTPTVRPQTIQEYFANKDRNEIKRLFANAPLGNSTIYVTDQYGFSLPVTRKEWIAVMNQKGAIVNDLQSDLEFLKTLSSSEAQNLWNNYNLGYIGESNTAAYPLSNGESRFISRTAWDKDQNRRSQEIFSRNQQAEATSYLQNVSQAKLNDLRINFNQQAYHSVFGNNAQDNKVIVGLPSGNYGLSKAELDQEQARRNAIEIERQQKLAAQRALQAQQEQANSNNFSGSVGSQALDLNYFSQKYQELTSQGKTADANKLLNNAQALGFSNEAVKGTSNQQNATNTYSSTTQTEYVTKTGVDYFRESLFEETDKNIKDCSWNMSCLKAASNLIVIGGVVDPAYTIATGKDLGTNQSASNLDKGLSYASLIPPVKVGTTVTKAAIKESKPVVQAAVKEVDNFGNEIKSLVNTNDSYFDKLASFRQDLGLPLAGSATDKSTVAMINVNGKQIYGINAHGQPVSGVNSISKTHAEVDALNQIKQQNINVLGQNLTLYVDRMPCTACGINGGIRSMVRQLGLNELKIVHPNGTIVITP